MANLHEQIKADLTAAMKAREATKLQTLRSLVTALTNEAVTKKEKPDTLLDDDTVLTVIRRAVKQRAESIEQYENAGREEQAAQERAEKEILEAYLPQMMSREEIEKVVQQKKDELEVTDKSDMGKLMGAVMQELKGKADGGDVKAAVEAALA